MTDYVATAKAALAKRARNGGAVPDMPLADAVRPGPSPYGGEAESNTPARCMTPENGARLIGAASPESASGSPYPSEPERASANELLGRVSMRLMSPPEGTAVGLWSDLDRPEVRAALAVFGSDKLPIRYLDGDVPMKYKVRRVPGEPVPLAVLEAMLRAPAEPWVVRDKMLEAMNWHPHGISWAEWQVQMLNGFSKSGACLVTRAESRRPLSGTVSRRNGSGSNR